MNYRRLLMKILMNYIQRIFYFLKKNSLIFKDKFLFLPDKLAKHVEFSIGK